MEESNPSQPRQKIMTSLHRGYSNALIFLKQGKWPEGMNKLKEILQHEFMSDTDMQNLKYSSLMSLAHIHEQLNQPQSALGKYWQALQILSQRSLGTLQKGLFNLKQFNEQRSHSEFTILLKMISITQKEQLTEHTIYLLKRAISLSPSIWREKLLLKLKELYQKENKMEALEDLNYLINNKKKMEQILTQNIIVQKQSKMIVQAPQRPSQPLKGYLKKLTIKLNIFQKEQQKLKYSCWENLLNVTYILLKCKIPKNFNKKKYKKIQQSKQWISFVNDFDPLKTNIEISLVQLDDSEAKMDIQETSSQSYTRVINDLAGQILKSQHIKKKSKRQVNPLQELTRNPSFASKDSKKQSITQTKSIYTSISEYYKDIFTKNGFKKELLTYVKILDENRFNQIFGKVFASEADLNDKKQDQADDQEEQKSLPIQVAGTNQQDKQAPKEKKSLKNRKLELIAQHQQLNSKLKRCFQKGSLTFPNIYEVIEYLTTLLITQKIDVNKDIDVLAFSSIRKVLQKNILKMVQATSGFFKLYLQPQTSQKQFSRERLQFLDLLLEKVEQLTDKQSKNKINKEYQQSKKLRLITFIKQYFSISVYQARSLLQQCELPSQQCQYFSALCLQFVRVNYLYGYLKPSEVSYYRNLYIAFRLKLEMNGETSKWITETIDRQIEKYQKKISNKTSLFVLTEEAEQNQSHNIDQIFKKDQELSLALPILKVFNCFNNEISKNSKNTEIIEQLNSKAYLQSFIKLSEIFFRKLETESIKQFNSRLLFLIADLMKIKQVIGDIYERFMHNTSFKLAEVTPQIFIQTLYHLIRFYLLNLYEENDHCIRIIFYISNIIFRLYSDEVKLTIIPKCIYLFDQLIKYKKFKPELISIIRKKFYQNLILKNLNFIYHSPIFRINEDQDVSIKKKRQRKNSSKSQSESLSEQLLEDLHDENYEIKEKVYDILHDIYFSTDKEKEFNPKKIEEAVGYFMYLLRAFHSDFRCQVVQLENEVCKLIKKCYKLYTEKRGEIFQYCQKFKNFKLIFEAIMNGDENPQLKSQFISILKKQKTICDCCCNLREKYSFYIQSLFVIGKFFESQAFRDDLLVDKQQLLLDMDKDENYYFQYLSLNLDSEIAWQNIIRVNANKTYIYFDSLIGEPFENYKGKFLYTKRIIQCVIDNFPSFKKLIEYSNEKQEILNTLKIKQRQYLMILKELQVKEMVNIECKQLKQYKDQTRKYKEGLKKIWQLQQKIHFADVKVRYLRVVQVKSKLIWQCLEKQAKQERREEVIELDKDEDEEEELSTFQPPANISQIVQILSDIQLTSYDLPSQQKSDYVIHLEEDLAIEACMFLYNIVDYKLDKLVSSLLEAINSSNDLQRNKAIKDAQYYLSDLGFTLVFFNERFLSNNQKYKIKSENVNVQAVQLEFGTNIFSNLFINYKEKDINRIQAVSKLIKNKNKNKKERQIIIINEDVNEQSNLEAVPEENIRKKSISENGSSKGQGKNKFIHVDVANYIAIQLGSTLKTDENFKNLSKLKYILFSTTFLENIQKTSKVFTELIRIYTQLPKYQTKRYKNRRSVGMGLLQCSMITLKYAMQPDRANDLIKQFYSIKSDELVTVNLHNERIATQKNQMLSEFYNRAIVHQIMKIRFIEHLFKIYEAQGNKQNLVVINRKLLKLSRSNEREVNKPEKEKEKMSKAIEIEQQRKQGAEVIQQEKDQKVLKQAKQVKDKEKQQKQQQIRCYFLLFCQGVSTFVNILKAQSEIKPVDQKYEKNLLEFKNRIKKSMGKDEVNSYFKKIDEFLIQYEIKYQKKIKMKKSKKQKEGETQKQDQIPQKEINIVKQDKIEQENEIILIQEEIEFEKIIEIKEQVGPIKVERVIKRKRKAKNLDISLGSQKSKSDDIKKEKKIKKIRKQIKLTTSEKKKKPNSTSKQKITRKPRAPRKKKSEQPIKIAENNS